MKHRVDITVFILIIFFLTQAFGLGLLAKEAEIVTTVENNVTIFSVYHGDTAIGERPQTEGFSSFALIVLVIIISTGLFLLIVKFAKHKIWKTWFFLAVWLSVTVSLGVFFDVWIAYVLSLMITVYKLSGRSVFVYNVGEILMYSGIGLIFSPMFDIFWVFILLIAISLYDMYAVWKSKHMIKMAKFQTKMRLFAGLLVPYGKNKLAILGGGDLGFPLIFVGVLFKSIGWDALIVIFTTTIALFLLLYYSKKNKFYPAMPFISLGCFVGYGLTFLI